MFTFSNIKPKPLFEESIPTFPYEEVKDLIEIGKLMLYSYLHYHWFMCTLAHPLYTHMNHNYLPEINQGTLLVEYSLMASGRGSQELQKIRL